MIQIPDEYSIRHAGYEPEPDGPICPICGGECEIVYKDKTGDIVGCNECLEPVDATDEEECFYDPRG